MVRSRCAIVVVLIALAISPVFAIDGYEIMKAVDEKPAPSTTHALVRLVLIDTDGSEAERIIEQWGAESGPKTASVIVFHSPASVKNSRFLILAEEGKPDNKWLYLPALRKVRRIAASEGDSSFMGTEFSYDDLSSRDPDDYRHTLLREETLDGYLCYVVESIAKPGVDSNYSRTVSWIVKDEDILTALKIEMYDNGAEPLKVFTVKGLEEIEGYWIPMEVSMKNLSNGKETLMVQQRIVLDEPVNTRLFTTRFLETGRAN